MKIININGEIIPFNTYSEQGYVNVADIDLQLKEANGDDIEVHIASPGGDVDEGFLIYTSLRKYTKQYSAKVTTYARGRCHSIATVIFLAGDERIANRFLEPFVHNAWTYAVGDSKELMRTAVDLEALNKRIATFYAEHTNLSYDEARDLMNGNSFISPEECLRIRFATQIDEVIRPAALSTILNKKTMNKNQKNNQSFFNKLKGLFEAEGFLNKLEVHTSNSDTLVFADLEEDATPSIGDKATINGEPASGEHTLNDGTVYKFESGELTEIDKKDEDEVESTVTAEEFQNLKKENDDLKKQLSAMNSTVSEIQKEQKGLVKKWTALNKLVSEHSIEDDDNEDKTSTAGKVEKKGLVGAIKNLKNKK